MMSNSLHVGPMTSCGGRAAKLGAAFAVASGYGASPLSALSRFKPDVVHVHNLFPNWAWRWLNEWDGPLVATLHNFRPLCAAGTLFRDDHNCLNNCGHRGTVS